MKRTVSPLTCNANLGRTHARRFSVSKWLVAPNGGKRAAN